MKDAIYLVLIYVHFLFFLWGGGCGEREEGEGRWGKVGKGGGCRGVGTLRTSTKAKF